MPELTADLARELFDYDPLTGVLTWKVSRGKIKKGTPAGYVNTVGYRVTMVNGKGYLNHRLAWLLATGKWPAMEIDHVNGVRDDNRICNLRDVSSSANKENVRTARSSNKTTGLLGASLYKRDGTYAAQITVGRKVTCLGRFATPEEAHLVYLDAKRRLHAANTL